MYSTRGQRVSNQTVLREFWYLHWRPLLPQSWRIVRGRERIRLLSRSGNLCVRQVHCTGREWRPLHRFYAVRDRLLLRFE